MKDLTIKMIYNLKEKYPDSLTYDDVLKKFYSEYSGIDPKFYDSSKLLRSVIECYKDYLVTCDNIQGEINILLDIFSVNSSCNFDNDIFRYKILDAICTALILSDVKKEKYGTNETLVYTNGFRDI